MAKFILSRWQPCRRAHNSVEGVSDLSCYCFGAVRTQYVFEQLLKNTGLRELFFCFVLLIQPADETSVFPACLGSLDSFLVGFCWRGNVAWGITYFTGADRNFGQSNVNFVMLGCILHVVVLLSSPAFHALDHFYKHTTRWDWKEHAFQSQE